VKNILFSLLFGIGFCQGQNPLPALLQQADPRLQAIRQDEAAHELQIIYTQILRNKKGTPKFKTYRYGLSGAHYFYPASTVKLALALLTLEKIKALQAQGIRITKEIPFEVYNPDTKELIMAQDSTHPKGWLTLSHQIKKLFLVSDNQAYNFLFDFLGQDYINATLKAKGYKGISLQHKFSATLDTDLNMAFHFKENGATHYQKTSTPPHPKKSKKLLKGLQKGKGFIDKGKLVERPMDFSLKNRAALDNLNEMLMAILFPKLMPTKRRFDITKEDLNFVRYWMSRNTTEVDVPNYKNDPHYWDSYVKFFLYGDQKGAMDPTIKIYNKVGLAYGTITDVAYIKNEQEGVDFFLAATLLVNKNDIFNDNQYEYDALGIPFLAALGKAVYDFELNRKD